MIAMRWEGADELLANLQATSKAFQRETIEDALLEAAEPIRRDVSRTARRAPGLPDLADNIVAAKLKKARGLPEFQVGIGVPRGFFYDWFLEFGTVHHRPFPMYRPPFDAGVPGALGTVGAAIWRELAGRGISRTVQGTTPVSGPGRFL